VASHLLLADMTPPLATPLHGSPFAIPPHGYSTLLLSCVVVPHVIPLHGSLGYCFSMAPHLLLSLMVDPCSLLPCMAPYLLLPCAGAQHPYSSLACYCSFLLLFDVPTPSLLVVPPHGCSLFACCYSLLVFPWMVLLPPLFFASSLWNYTQ